ncbi:MAG TPA: citrate/2-methylcitrate synthase [Nitrospirota bacterium]|nr:citrate/2-methylcitrate synthase [Nitrospirota bacterium]
MVTKAEIRKPEEEKTAGTVRTKNMGLRGVTVADTRVSFIDGENGVLIYRGYLIEELAVHSTFEETAYLLLHDALPTESQLKEFTRRLVEARQVPDFLFESFKKLPKEAKPMDVLQASVPLLAMADPDLPDETREANVNKAIRLIARIPIVAAGWHRIRQGREPLRSDDRLSHAGNFLWLLTGIRPDPETARDLDTCLVLHADHTFNASTFAAREVVSTRAHMYAGAAAAVGALSGSLHGGANAEVMKMLKEVENEKDIPGWVRKQLDSGRKIMGMGHAVYKTTDPRAKFLKEMSERLGKKLGQEKWYRLSTRIEDAAVSEFEKRGKTTIKPNVDFYSASVYHLMGIPGDLMTPVFAVSRIAGWTAHIIEEKFAEAQEKPALYRPASEYVGHYCGRMGCTYVPVQQRTRDAA